MSWLYIVASLSAADDIVLCNMYPQVGNKASRECALGEVFAYSVSKMNITGIHFGIDIACAYLLSLPPWSFFLIVVIKCLSRSLYVDFLSVRWIVY